MHPDLQARHKNTVNFYSVPKRAVSEEQPATRASAQPKKAGPSQPDPYTPNQLSPRHRSDNLFLALLLLSYGIAGLLTHRMKFSTRGRLVLFLEGGSAWLMAFACLVGACVFLSWIVDHYDTRNNERYYRAFRWLASRVGWALVAASLAVHLYVGFTT